MDSRNYLFSTLTSSKMLQWSLHPLRFPRYRGTETLGIAYASKSLLSLNRIFHFSTFIVLISLLLMSCGNSIRESADVSADSLFLRHDSLFATVDRYSDTIVIKYAKGLEVDYREDGIHVRISNPDPSVRHGAVEELVITHPSSRFICTTALQLGNFEVLGLEDRIVGMNSLKNIFDNRIRRQMDEGLTARIGKEGVFDIETVIALRPDYIFVSASKHGGFEALRESGIPIITHHGYKETNPLGQAEWIKLVGLLTGEPRRANAVFGDIETKYLKLKEEVKEKIGGMRPTVASGRQLRDGWYIVGGQSYLAQLFEDAGADYVMADNEDSGGTTLDFEEAFAKSVNADFWQIDGAYDGDYTLETLANEDARYVHMKAFTERKVLFCNLSRTPYRELSPVEPHILLADFVKAFYPELLPHYVPKYYKLIGGRD